MRSFEHNYLLEQPISHEGGIQGLGRAGVLGPWGLGCDPTEEAMVVFVP